MSGPSSHSEPRQLVLLDPAHLERAERILGPGVRAWRVSRSRLGSQWILIELTPPDARRVRDDPVLGRLRIRSEIEGVERLEPFPLGRRPIRKPTPLPPGNDAILRGRLGESPPRGFSPPRGLAAAVPRLAGPGSKVRRDITDALWIAAPLVPRFLSYLEGAPPSVWDAFRIHAARGGIVARGPVPARRDLAARGLALAVPLHGGESRGGHALHIEHGALAPALRDLIETEGDLLIRIERGRIVSERIGPGMAASALLRHASTPVDAIPWPAAREPSHADLRSRDAAAKLFAGLGAARKEDTELRRVLESAFGKPGGRGAKSAKGDEGQGGGWLRRFLPYRLDEALRRKLDLASRKRLADPAERARIIAKQRDAIARLLEGLSGARWKEALSLALPLRRPGDIESDSTWLHAAGGPEEALDTEFDLERAAMIPRGVFGVGPRVHAQLHALYRRSGEALIASRDYRRAAHVFSYLLGDHSRAGAILEQGGFYREAATVHYHLAKKPQSAAVALERGGLHDEAARIWMDLLRWPEAARAWKAAGDVAQARAAWRRVALDLEKSRRMLEAADVLERELDEPEAARCLLERCAMACDPESIEALERCARAWVDAGEEERAAVIFARARARYEWAASGGADRAPLSLLANLAVRAARWSADDPVRIAAGEDAWRSIWVSAATAWARGHADSHLVSRREMNARLLEAAQAGPDPWLLPDAERWLRSLVPAGPGIKRVDVEEVRMETRASSLVLGSAALFVGLENGRIAILRAGCDPAGYLETGASKPIIALASSRTDLYSATADEIHHFADLEHGPDRPMQIEHTIPSVKSMVLFPGAGLLAIGSGSAHLLHPGHLAKLPFVNEPEFSVILECCGNTRLAALLLRNHPAVHEARLFQRREIRGGIQLRLIERLELPPGNWRRIGFLAPDGDDLVVVGEEALIVYPSRRDRWRRFDLQVSSKADRLPAARVLVVPGLEVLLVAYGDGSLERIDPVSGERRILLDGPENLDPLVGFACFGSLAIVRGPPWTAWLLHASGLLRAARAGGDRTHT